MKRSVMVIAAGLVLAACSKATPTAEPTPSTSVSPSPAPSFSPSPAPSPCVTAPAGILATLNVASKDLADVIAAAKKVDLKGIIAKERDAAGITSTA